MTSPMFKITNDRKTRKDKYQKNTFGLMPGPLDKGGSCPGATTHKGGCYHIAEGRKTATCYVDKLTKVYKGVKASLEHNTKIALTASEAELETMFTDMFEMFRLSEKMKGNTTDLWFRHHWSGDMPNEQYCRAIKAAMLKFPDVNFWTYTRSWFAVPILYDIPNLVLYVSADEVNLNQAVKIYLEYKDIGNVSLAYMGKENITNKERLVACPVDNDKMALEEACHKCKICLKGKPVFFKIK